MRASAFSSVRASAGYRASRRRRSSSSEKGPRRVSPFFIPGSLINLSGGIIGIHHGCKGPNHAVVTACATGSHAIGDAGRLIALDDADVMIAGGAESSICRVGIAGFIACKALSTHFNDTPEKGLATL